MYNNIMAVKKLYPSGNPRAGANIKPRSAPLEEGPILAKVKETYSALKSAEKKLRKALKASNSNKDRRAERKLGMDVQSARKTHGEAEKAYEASLQRLARRSPERLVWEIEQDALGKEYRSKLKHDLIIAHQNMEMMRKIMAEAEQSGNKERYAMAALDHKEATEIHNQFLRIGRCCKLII
jgi:hypothetical protein